VSVVIDKQLLAEAIPTPIRDLCVRLAEAGFGVWCVGGAIRDAIWRQWGAPRAVGIGDWDIASTATPDQVTRLFRRVVPSGIRHGTVTVVLPNQSVEVTTLRGEQGYSDGRHPDSVVFVKDIVQDLARRDFTINAIAYDPIANQLIDPFGGIDDLVSRCLRAVGDPRERFSEDGLRVLRAARFAATLGVDIEAHTQAAIRYSLDSYRKVSAERIRDEWTKALGAPLASRAFNIMLAEGILGITAPELVDMKGCVQNRHHRYDVWEHTLRTVDGITNKSLQLRLAALLHDVGKPVVRDVSSKTEDYIFHDHEVQGSRLADAIMRRLKFPNNLREPVVALVRHHIVVYCGSWTDSAVRRWINRVTQDLLWDILELARADVAAKGYEVKSQIQALDELEERVRLVLASRHAFTIGDLAVSGKELMQELGLTPGPIIGLLLRSLLDEVLEAPEHNERERLLDRARELLKSSASGAADLASKALRD
jgi:tRNA nucleotidyltransferase (CCA-adding enzyme)